jgi:hypothetical protein
MQGGCVPISRAEFEQGSDETDEKIMDLLSGSPDKAFSINEVVGVIYGDPPADVMDIILRIPRLAIGVGSALDVLARQGVLDRRIVNEITYYSIKQKS